ncbi:MAG TPA: hypothetical protein VIP70_11095 [Nitrososphaeraceae archaeon]
MRSVEADVQQLELAKGIKDSLEKAGFTIDSILNHTPVDISKKLGIDLYVAQIILEVAKRAVTPPVSKRIDNDLEQIVNT